MSDLPPLEPTSTKLDSIPVIPVGTSASNQASTKLLELFKGNAFQITIGLTAWWGYRSLRSMGKVLDINYSDLVYQIRRPDIIANRITAFKYLVVGGAFVPLSVFGTYYLIKSFRPAYRQDLKDGLMVIPVQHEELQDRVHRVNSRFSNFLDRVAPNRGETIQRFSVFVKNINNVVKSTKDPNFASRVPTADARSSGEA